MNQSQEEEVSQQEQPYEGSQEEDRQQQFDESQKQPMTVSVSQLQQQQLERDPRMGGPPLYEQEARIRHDNNRQAYTGELEQVTCGRFPHMDFCACDVDFRDISLIEVYQGIYMGPFQSAFKTGDLIEAGVTHILNVSSKAYTKRDRYFKYLDLQLYDEPQENAKKYFRITNRFINEAQNSGGKILVHSYEGKSRCATFILAYMICNEGLKLRDSLNQLR